MSEKIVIVVPDLGFFNFYHCLMYCLCGARHIPENIKVSKVYAPLYDNRFNTPILNILFPDATIVNSKTHSITEKTVITLENDFDFEKTSHEIYSFFRKKFLPFVGKKQKEFNRVYISRRDNATSHGHKNISSRHIHNEAEMMKKLSPLGFREVHLEELSFYYHINIFYHAEIVLASHGAALTNAIFAGEKTNIVEIKIGNQPHFIDICNKMGISHRNIGTEILYNTDKEENGYIKVDELANYIITNFGTPKPYILHYVIHNDDPTRREKMTAEFEKCGIPDVKWMIYPNRKDFTPEFRQKYIRDNVVHYNGENICSVGFFNDQCGLVSCTYKHYAALKDAVENNCDYCLVMEDNSTFDKDVYKLTLEKYIPQLNELYGNEWDGFFNLENNEWGVYEENPVVDGIYVYPKSNARARSEGSTKAGRYYIFKRDFAKRVVDAYLPIYAAPDAQMNFIFRNLNARMFWIQPPTVFNDPTHISCAYKEN